MLMWCTHLSKRTIGCVSMCPEQYLVWTISHPKITRSKTRDESEVYGLVRWP